MSVSRNVRLRIGFDAGAEFVGSHRQQNPPIARRRRCKLRITARQVRLGTSSTREPSRQFTESGTEPTASDLAGANLGVHAHMQRQVLRIPPMIGLALN